MIERKPIIGVMGSHQKDWDELAAPIGELIADMGYHLLTGAGPASMTIAAKAFVEKPGREGVSIGIVPVENYDGDLVPRELYPNPYIEIPVFTPLGTKEQRDSNPFSRNYVNVMTSHALVILPGDQGTRNEVSLGIQYKKSMILYGPKDAFVKFPEQTTRVSSIEGVREFLEHVDAKIRSDCAELPQDALE